MTLASSNADRTGSAMTVSPAWYCSGDGPGTHVECGFATDSLTAAMDHFEATGHAVDEVCAKPALLSVIHLGRGRGLRYEARFVCGHVATGVFPFAKANHSRKQIERWLFGPNGDEVCGVACREVRP